MASDKILNCDLHDYLEIACMFHYQVELLLKDGTRVVGEARDTKVNSAKEELLELVDASKTGTSDAISIKILSLKKMTVLTKGARFSEVDFS